MESQVQVPVASESTNKTIRFWAPVASGLVPAEPPTMVQPLHRLSLGSLRCRHTATGTSSIACAMPCVKLSLELPRRTGSGVTGASLQCIKDKDRSVDHAATVTSYRVRHAASAHKTPRSNPCTVPMPSFDYKRE